MYAFVFNGCNFDVKLYGIYFWVFSHMRNAAEKNLGRCMLDYGGRRTVPEYMNNTCEILQRRVAADTLQCGGGVPYLFRYTIKSRYRRRC